MPESYAWECQQEECSIGGELIARDAQGEEISRHVPDSCPICGGKVQGISREKYEADYEEEE